MGIAGVVLAAGAGTRMGQPKAEIVVDGLRLVDRAVAALRDGGCFPVYAIVRPGVAVDCAILNPEPERGLRSSLQVGVDAAAASDGIAVLLADLPGVSSAAVSAVLAAWRPGRIAVARFGDMRGHPIVMSPALWREAIDLAAPDEGARALQRHHPELVDEVPVAGDPSDLDTPADLDRWRRR